MISYSISNTVNYDVVGIGVIDPESAFPSIYGNVDFGYTVTFLSSNGSVTDVSVTEQPSFTNVEVLSPNSVRIERNSEIAVFEGELYRFTDIDTDTGSIALFDLLPQLAETATPDVNLYEWITPPIKSIDGHFDFEITVDANTEILNYTQSYLWSPDEGEALLISLVNQGNI